MDTKTDAPTVTTTKPSTSLTSTTAITTTTKTTTTTKPTTKSNTTTNGLEMASEVPDNINNPIVLGNSNESATKFSFNNDLPEYFKYIYGTKILRAEFYANGELKINSGTNAKKGFITPAFFGNLKLEIKLYIGQMNNCNDKVDDNTPCIIIEGYDKDGNLVRTSEIENFDMSKQNSYIRTYMDGTDISYLIIKCMSQPYKGSQAYNFGIKGLELIAWPYPLN